MSASRAQEFVVLSLNFGQHVQITCCSNFNKPMFKRFHFIQGPVCVAFSLMGRRRKEQDISFRTHEKYYQEYGKSNSVLIVENVTEYSEEIVAARLGPSWRIQATRLDPRIFGMGVSRPRLYMICYDSDHVRWDADFTLNEFVTALAAKPVLTARDYFWEKVPKTRLTNAEEPQQKQ